MTQAQKTSGKMPPAEWRGRSVEYPRDTPVHALFEEQASTAPDAMALVNGADYLTYGQLNTRANGLAAALTEHGVGTGVTVGVCMDRSMDLIVTLLGILKAGGCYVPLDPAYPTDRLKLMAEETNVRVIVASRGSAARELEGDFLYLDEVEPRTANPGHKICAAGAAYVMFTSGSTGRPKGVAVPHRAIVRLVRNSDFMTLDVGETMLQFAPVSFDASTLEIWGPLLNGGRVAIAPPGQLSLDQIGAAIRKLGVTAMWLTSGLFNLMADEQLSAFAPLRQLLAGGDVLSIAHVRKVMDAHPRLRLINGYGPTESTTFACCHQITTDDLERKSIPIGKPIPNTTVRILDEAGTDAPLGDAGELYIGGDGLAIGYWNQPALTKERFVQVDGERFYRTGDRVAWLPDGSIEFLGRQDNQVKVRGYRIELGEIEAALTKQPGVKQSVVVALGDGADKQLAAYFVGDANPTELRDALRHALPEYMTPAFFTGLDVLPLTENGKVDRKRLPAPKATETKEFEPANDVERTLAEIWGAVLPHPGPGLNDNFFDIGGTSLKLVEAHSRLVRALKRQIPVTALFEYPTIAKLAAYLSPGAAAPGPSRLLAAATRARLQKEALARKQLQGRTKLETRKTR
jgi:amino acid adenylation domain-containing protein